MGGAARYVVPCAWQALISHHVCTSLRPPLPPTSLDGRRLTDIKANSKFSSPYATAEDIRSVRGGGGSRGHGLGRGWLQQKGLWMGPQDGARNLTSRAQLPPPGLTCPCSASSSSSSSNRGARRTSSRWWSTCASGTACSTSTAGTVGVGSVTVGWMDGCMGCTRTSPGLPTDPHFAACQLHPFSHLQ